MDGAEKRGVGSHQDDVPTLCLNRRTNRQAGDQVVPEQEGQCVEQLTLVEADGGHGVTESRAPVKGG